MFRNQPSQVDGQPISRNTLSYKWNGQARGRCLRNFMAEIGVRIRLVVTFIDWERRGLVDHLKKYDVEFTIEFINSFLIE